MSEKEWDLVIVVEGPDASGKTTLCTQIKKFFNDEKIWKDNNLLQVNCRVVHMPSDDFEVLGDNDVFNSHRFITNIHEVYTSHTRLYHEEDKFNILVMDRAFISTAVYQGEITIKECDSLMDELVGCAQLCYIFTGFDEDLKKKYAPNLYSHNYFYIVEETFKQRGERVPSVSEWDDLNRSYCEAFQRVGSFPLPKLRYTPYWLDIAAKLSLKDSVETSAALSSKRDYAKATFMERILRENRLFMYDSREGGEDV